MRTKAPLPRRPPHRSGAHGSATRPNQEGWIIRWTIQPRSRQVRQRRDEREVEEKKVLYACWLGSQRLFLPGHVYFWWSASDRASLYSNARATASTGCSQFYQKSDRPREGGRLAHWVSITQATARSLSVEVPRGERLKILFGRFPKDYGVCMYFVSRKLVALRGRLVASGPL